MESSKSLAEELVKALQDDHVRAMIGGLFEDKLRDLLETVSYLKAENEQKTAEITHLTTELSAAQAKIDELEAYNRRENLVIAGLPLVNMAEAASTEAEPGVAPRRDDFEHSETTEKIVINLCRETLKVPITAADISVAHRLKRNTEKRGPPAVIVRFTNRKARDAVYAARYVLRNIGQPIFINEDLTATASSLFFQARKLVTSKRIYKAWTYRGMVFIKEFNSTASKAKLVRSAADLPNSG